MDTLSKPIRSILVLFVVCFFGPLAQAKYSGGTGEPNDPYQIATAADLIALGETPEDYDKHFILTADIDLDPNLPGRKVFDKAVIAPHTDDTKLWYQGVLFTGAFNGNTHVISHLTIVGDSYLGLFGLLGYHAEVKDLGVVNVNVTGSGNTIGGLVGHNSGSIGQCCSSSTVSGDSSVGGLVGYNEGGRIATSYSTGAVSSDRGSGGGLVGSNDGSINMSYSSSTVSGKESGGLVGWNSYRGRINASYSSGTVTGAGEHVGGLVGMGDPRYVIHSVWDIENSGQSGSDGGVGLTTAEMMDTYMLGINGFANDPNWVLDPDSDYPRLAWEGAAGTIIPEPNINWLPGQGTPEDPYQIGNADQLILLGKASILSDKQFVLTADIDLDPNLPSGKVFAQAVIVAFRGVFDGNCHKISHLTIRGTSLLGLFGYSTANIYNLGLEEVDIHGTGIFVGGLVGRNGSLGIGGSLSNCYSTGSIRGGSYVGGLVGGSFGDTMIHCHSTGAVMGDSDAGGPAGWWATM